MNIFLADVSYRYGPSHSEYNKLQGGSVFAFVYSDDVRNVISRVEQSLTMQEIEVLTFDSIFPYAGDSAETPEIEVQFGSLAEEAETSNKVVFADFYAYKND